MLRPQDVVVVLKLVTAGDPFVAFNRLAVELGMSPSEVHQALGRAAAAGLVHTEADGRRQKKQVNRAALLEFLVHGLKYVFPAHLGSVTRGLPTAWAAPVLKGALKHSRDDLPPVWPDSEGDVRGLELAPLYSAVPGAARRDSKLYDLLALVDAIRGGRARERKLAADELRSRLDHA